MARIQLSNFADEESALRGQIPREEVRALEVEALVDTGATMLALPADIVSRLGVRETERRKVRLADGSIRDVARVSGLRVVILGRDMTCDALVMPAGSTPLIGQVQLEVLDLIVDAKSRDVAVNPASPDVPTLDLLAYGGTRSSEPRRESTNPKPIEQAKNRYLALAMPALRRARKRAEEIAIATKTALIQVENGQIVRVYPGGEREPRNGK